MNVISTNTYGIQQWNAIIKYYTFMENELLEYFRLYFLRNYYNIILYRWYGRWKKDKKNVPIVLEDYVAHMRLHNRETQGAHPMGNWSEPNNWISYCCLPFPLGTQSPDFPAEPL